MDEQAIAVMGARLANRAYLFRVFHIIFGAEPSAEELRVLSDQSTLQALAYLRDQGLPDSGSAAICGAADTAEPAAAGSAAEAAEADPAATTPAAAETLTQTLELLVAFGGKLEDAEYIDSLKSVYTRLFLVPGVSYVYPWESPYVGTTAVIFTKSTLDVRNRYREHGFTALEYPHFPEDHVAMMLDFLAHLSNRAFDAFVDGDDAELMQVLAAQNQFISKHLTNWLGLFQEELDAQDRSGLYSLFTRALRVFLELDGLFLQDALSNQGQIDALSSAAEKNAQ